MAFLLYYFILSQFELSVGIAQKKSCQNLSFPVLGMKDVSDSVSTSVYEVCASNG